MINILIIIQESYPINNDLLEEENILTMLNERDIEAEIETENLRIPDKEVIIGPNWEKVIFFKANCEKIFF